MAGPGEVDAPAHPPLPRQIVPTGLLLWKLVSGLVRQPRGRWSVDFSLAASPRTPHLELRGCGEAMLREGQPGLPPFKVSMGTYLSLLLS